MATRNGVLEAGYAVARVRGLAAVSFVSVSQQISISAGAVQGHFPSVETLRVAVIQWWAEEVRNRILQHRLGERGLAAAWNVVERAVLLASWLRIPFDALIGPARPLVRNALLQWVDEIELLLLQARYLDEIVPGTDIRLLARRLCRVLWSEQLLRELVDPQEGAVESARAAWSLLASAAKDPLADLPPLPQRLDEIRLRIPSRQGAHVPHAPDDEYNGVELMFRDLLDLTDPLRHALERARVLGEDYTLARPPPILEEDIAAARAVEERIAAGLPEVPPKLL